jgi:hypothetical protein
MIIGFIIGTMFGMVCGWAFSALFTTSARADDEIGRELFERYGDELVELNRRKHQQRDA